MNTEKLNTTLTLTANVGVLIGLFLVAYELRQNDDSLNASIQLSISQSYENISTLSIENTPLHDALVEVFTGTGEIDIDTLMTIMAWQGRYLTVLYTTYNLYLEGIVTESFWQEKASHFTVFLLQSSRMRSIYESSLHDEIYSPEFKVALETILAEQLAATQGATQ